MRIAKLVVVIWFLLAFVANGAAQTKPKKVYVFTDTEGVSGIFDIDLHRN
ncbi:MAG TPA: hypothetical protein VMX97_07040 [Hyphomicrobiaceae bacterium]|nr:hypothetical protein [Hyphomicrobiaceae bacterium]